MNEFQIMLLCEAYESGFGDGYDNRTEKGNPYPVNGELWMAYQHGFQSGKDRADANDH